MPHLSELTYEGVIEVLTDILEGSHGFKTLILDTVDKLDDIVTEYTLRTNKWDKMDYTGYGNKFMIKSSNWRNIFKLLDRIWYEKSMCIITIGHSKVSSVNEPNIPTYDAFMFATIGKNESSYIEDNSDVVVFVNIKKFASSDGTKNHNKHHKPKAYVCKP